MRLDSGFIPERTYFLKKGYSIMSSVSRSYPTATATTTWVPIRSPTYQNNVTDHRVLVPFTYSNGVLDVATVPGFNPSDGENFSDGYSWRMVKALGGTGVVNTLGTSFLSWFSAVVDGWDEGTTPEIFTAPVMMKVRQSVPSGGNSLLNSEYVIRYGRDEAPSSDEFATGTDTTHWDTAWIFKTPLVIKYRVEGTPQYASIYTYFTK